MLNVYISFAPNDAAYLVKLLNWLKPLEEQYFLRIWHNRAIPKAPELPVPWNLLFFWYSPPKPNTPYHPSLPQKLEEAHIYLFLVSHNSYMINYIENEEIPKAVDRFQRLGKDYIRLCPIQVAPSMWKQHSRLALFPPFGPKKSLKETQPEEEGYLMIAQSLRPIIEELRRNWMEEYKRLDLPLDGFHKKAPPPPPPPQQFVPLPGWAGWVILFLILFSVGNWFINSCAPRTYRRWMRTPPRYEKAPVEYPREVPYTAPQPLPLPPQDTFVDVQDTLR